MDGFVTVGYLNHTVDGGSFNYFIYGDGADGESNGALGAETIITSNRTDILGRENRDDYLVGTNMAFWQN